MKNCKEYQVGDTIEWCHSEHTGVILKVLEDKYVYTVIDKTGELKIHPGFAKDGLHQATKLLRKASKLHKILE